MEVYIFPWMFPGVDLRMDQWSRVVQVCEARQLLPVLDSAYQGFASGDLTLDASSARLWARGPFGGPFFVTQSFAKNLGLYGERIGMVHAICTSKTEAEAVLSQLKIVARRAYSNPPLHGARLLARVLGAPALRRQWEEELKGVASRIQRVRRLLREGLEKKETPGPWSHITEQIGMFSYTGLTKEQCELLISKWHVYLLKNGRISMAGVNEGNVDYLVEAIDDVVRTAPSR
ncbi:aspartate aminotransferase, putative [Eimeria brunetti]|uniref:Aspartate aminotransferase n=1 Tax=Eimeria brunetti TaxID=51314 RepID=U6LC01_9EIME|nr:aspartate aminotransferase, putative [Eimeria brunetti]